MYCTYIHACIHAHTHTHTHTHKQIRNVAKGVMKEGRLLPKHLRCVSPCIYICVHRQTNTHTHTHTPSFTPLPGHNALFALFFFSDIFLKGSVMTQFSFFCCAWVFLLRVFSSLTSAEFFSPLTPQSGHRSSRNEGHQADNVWPKTPTHLTVRAVRAGSGALSK